MRVALLTREFLPDTQWGGIGSYYAELARSLVRAGAEVEVFTQSLGQPRREWIDKVYVHGRLPRWYAFGPRRGGPLGGMAPRALGSFAAALARELASCFERRHVDQPFDVVESHEHLGVGALLRSGRGRPRHIVRYHTAYDLLVGRGLEPWPRSRMIRWLEGNALRSADLRIAPSAFIERETRRHFRAVPRAEEEIPLACRFSPIDTALLERKEPMVVFVGRLQQRKQPLVAVSAFVRIAQQHPEWRLAIAGADGTLPDGSSTAEACRVVLGGLRDRASFLGPLGSEDLVSLLTKAAVCIVPSTFESFGLVALEAMSQGCVPIVSAGHALEEVVGDAGCVAPVGDAAGFSRHLERLVANPGERVSRAHRAVERSRAGFDAADILSRNVAVYERLASRGET